MAKYRSKLEESFAVIGGLRYKHEPIRLKYITRRERTYTPDFVDDDNKTIIECKGRIREIEELKAYVDFRNQHPEYRMIFVLENPHIKAYRQSKKETLSQWLEKNGFEWNTLSTFPKELRGKLK